MTDSPYRERLRFVDFELQHLQTGQCRARVTLEWEPGVTFVGTWEEFGSQAAELRCAAQATLAAMEQAVGAQRSFSLLGVKAVRAFDATVVIVSLATQAEARTSRLVGSFITDQAAPRGAALAVLNATNRVLRNTVSRSE